MPVVSPGSQLPQTTVPVQVLLPRKDIFVTPALQRFTGTVLQGGRVIPIEGGHWVVTSRPDVVARLTGEWVDRNAGGVAKTENTVVRGGPREVRGKLALVTGAGAGIGRATAVELARRGARKVVIVDRDLASADETADAVRAACAEAAVYQADVSDEAAMNDLAAQVHNDHGVVDILINLCFAAAILDHPGFVGYRKRRPRYPVPAPAFADHIWIISYMCVKQYPVHHLPLQETLISLNCFQFVLF